MSPPGDDPRLRSLDPTPAEVAVVRDPFPRPVARQVATWTTPSPAEIQRLQARAPRPVPAATAAAASYPSRWAWGPQVWAAAALAFLFLLRVHPATTPEPERPVPIPITAALDLELPTGPLAINADIQAEGRGDLRVLAADAQGARVEVRAGALTFEVDPQGSGRDLVVVAGEVEVRVTGTRFTVQRQGGRVQVSVARGSVRVRHPDGEVHLGAGGVWSSPEAAAVAEQPSLPSVSSPLSPPPPLALLTPSPAAAAAVPREAEAGRGVELFVALLDAEAAGRPPTDLLVLCDVFLSAYGAVPMREEVEVIRMRQLRALRPAEAVIPEVEVWLSAHPGSPHQAELLLLLGDLWVDALGDCAAGRPSYTAVMEIPTRPTQQAQARARLAACTVAP